MPTDALDLPLSNIVDDLAEQGWSLQPLFAPTALTLELAAECRRRAAQGALTPAGVGKAQEVREGIRGDRIEWLDAGQSAACDRYLALLDELRLTLNRGLFLGLEDYESHFALYPPGAFYQKHLDRFRDDDRRAVSVVLYLNPDWQPEHGGALRLYLADGSTRDIPPRAGSLVAFLSAEMLHEVLPTSRERLSLTGWFRRRGTDPL
ncbi:2OG-Fe(II) oxygenase [Pseudomonas lalucatii]|uniref:2OG-Fe(II) oxygenase n=1 Tax=Pseudomonas lalucatii TaxID=1424203 RepID=A0ABS5Q265_9PSED|nr:2OG-Fe(II) oxygenase [Pseudomonas lalucatii]MBS7662860.1 2OG-Fe(II) oxygenase [Pseudomonas lalucatii]QVM88725.1 2OG-Fe(II) oxygenase [Pseudomonas lalucatii]